MLQYFILWKFPIAMEKFLKLLLRKLCLLHIVLDFLKTNVSFLAVFVVTRTYFKGFKLWKCKNADILRKSITTDIKSIIRNYYSEGLQNRNQSTYIFIIIKSAFGRLAIFWTQYNLLFLNFFDAMLKSSKYIQFLTVIKVKKCLSFLLFRGYVLNLLIEISTPQVLKALPIQ